MGGRFIIGAALLIVGGACSADLAGPGLPGPAHAEQVEASRLPGGQVPFTSYSGLERSERIVVREAAAWERVWGRIHANLSPMPALPNVDFDRASVVVVALGPQPSGGYSVVVDGARRTADAIEISVRIVRPGRSCVVPSVITSPVDLVRIPASDLPIRFEVTERTEECR